MRIIWNMVRVCDSDFDTRQRRKYGDVWRIAALVRVALNRHPTVAGGGHTLMRHDVEMDCALGSPQLWLMAVASADAAAAATHDCG